MPSHHFTFHEHKGFIGSDNQPTTNISDLGLTAGDISRLQRYAETLIPGKSIFDFTNSTIKAKSIVGMFSYGNIHIEILPKLIASDESNSSIVENLMYMLSYTYSLDVPHSGLTLLGKDHENFIEAYIDIFATQLSLHIQRYGVPKSYIENEDNLNHIKGRIIFSRNTILNNIDRSKNYCEFSEFSENNPTSIAFKYVAIKLIKLTRNSKNSQTLHRCVGLLDGVTPDYVTPDILERTQYGKRDLNFLGLIQLTKMFLRKLRPEFGGNANNEVFSILFDMNELFEEFIYEVLHRNSKALGIKVKAQRKKRLVMAERDIALDSVWIKRPLFDTYTDIEVTFNDGRSPLIIDTKYKLIGDKHHYGIANADVYQILTYRQIHKKGSHEPNILLLYPRHEMELHKEFQVSNSGATFSACTINLSRDLKNDLQALVNDLGRIMSL